MQGAATTVARTPEKKEEDKPPDWVNLAPTPVIDIPSSKNAFRLIANIRRKTALERKQRLVPCN